MADSTAPRATDAPTGADLLVQEQWLGEQRVNWLRLGVIAAFYLVHLLRVYAWQEPSAQGSYHLWLTALCIGWALAAGAMAWTLAQRWLPPWLKYGAALWDLTLVGAVLALGDGPRSPMLLLLPVVIAAAGVRLSLPYVWACTGGAAACYLAVLGHYAWVKVGYHAYYATVDPLVRIPRSQELLILLALVGTGLFVGQAVRQARRLLAAAGARA